MNNLLTLLQDCTEDLHRRPLVQIRPLIPQLLLVPENNPRISILASSRQVTSPPCQAHPEANNTELTTSARLLPIPCPVLRAYEIQRCAPCLVLEHVVSEVVSRVSGIPIHGLRVPHMVNRGYISYVSGMISGKEGRRRILNGKISQTNGL